MGFSCWFSRDWCSSFPFISGDLESFFDRFIHFVIFTGTFQKGPLILVIKLITFTSFWLISTYILGLSLKAHYFDWFALLDSGSTLKVSSSILDICLTNFPHIWEITVEKLGFLALFDFWGHYFQVQGFEFVWGTFRFEYLSFAYLWQIHCSLTFIRLSDLGNCSTFKSFFRPLADIFILCIQDWLFFEEKLYHLSSLLEFISLVFHNVIDLFLLFRVPYFIFPKIWSLPLIFIAQ